MDRIYTELNKSDIVNNISKKEIKNLFKNNADSFDMSTANIEHKYGSIISNIEASDHYYTSVSSVNGEELTIYAGDKNATPSGSYDGHAYKLNYDRTISTLYKKINNESNYFNFDDGNINQFIAVDLCRNNTSHKINPDLIISANGLSNKLIAVADKQFINNNDNYNILNGEIYSLFDSVSESKFYGYLFANLGLIILDANKFDGDVIDNYGTNFNTNLIFNFTNAHAVKRVKHTTVFCRLLNNKYNFSNNPTWMDENYRIRQDLGMVGDPNVYVTTVGLYNNNNELIVLGRTNKPIRKTFERELSIQLKLKF